MRLKRSEQGRSNLINLSSIRDPLLLLPTPFPPSAPPPVPSFIAGNRRRGESPRLPQGARHPAARALPGLGLRAGQAPSQARPRLGPALPSPGQPGRLGRVSRAGILSLVGHSRKTKCSLVWLDSTPNKLEMSPPGLHHSSRSRIQVGIGSHPACPSHSKSSIRLPEGRRGHPPNPSQPPEWATRSNAFIAAPRLLAG